MSKPISLFSGYSQKENRVTNYCLLILKMLYEENPKYLGEVLAVFCGEEFASHVGVSFRQQAIKGASIPDGLILQQPFTIYIETKNYDWFYDEQLEKHLNELNKEVSGKKILLALGNFEDNHLDKFKKIRDVCAKKYNNNIIFRAITFEDLIGAMSLAGLSKNLTDAITDFGNFLNEENLLPSWREYLDVINCAGIPEDVLDGNVYMCPAEGGAYSHSRTRYFGMYRNKCVELVAEIEAIVDVDIDADSISLKWKNVSGTDVSFKEKAKEKVRNLRPSQGAIRVFLLGQLYKTDFQKDSRGGMFSSKRYFNIAQLQARNAEELSDKLNGKKWSEFE